MGRFNTAVINLVIVVIFALRGDAGEAKISAR